MKPRPPSLRLLRLLRLDPLDLLVRETFGSGDAGACAWAWAWACECRLDREKEERPLSEAKGELRRRRRGDETSGLSGITTGFSLVPSPCVRLVGLPGVLEEHIRVSCESRNLKPGVGPGVAVCYLRTGGVNTPATVWTGVMLYKPRFNTTEVEPMCAG